ncbi:RloB family protein [Amycolatopsis sp. NBC_00355]|uniref:RloB family protein n=1 Tax=Amycolatopsis sp. NBC_00355 TaxID=2975957 RepID=UPI002E2622A3
MARNRNDVRSRTSLSRTRGTRQERRRILIVTEGEETEPDYFKGLAASLRATGVDVQSMQIIGEGRDPMRVVKRAALLSNEGRSIGKRDGYDSVWCVIDVDDHAGLPNAIIEAKALGFSVSISNPCFEIWLLWHFIDCTRYMTREDLKAALKKRGHEGKSVSASFPFASVKNAINRASGATVDMPDNPGSGVWRLVEVLDQGGRLKA